MKNLIGNFRNSLTKAVVLSVAFSLFLFTTSCDKEETPAPNNPPGSITDTVSTYSGTIELAYLKSTNPDPACFLDLASGKVYKVSEGKAHAADIDMLWGTRTVTPDQKYFIGTSDSYILNAAGASDDLWKESDLFVGWGKRNATMMNDFAQIGFDDVKTRAQFNTYTSGQSGILTYIPFEGKADQLTRTYYYDITHNGVKYVGILKITQADLADEWAKFTIKVIKAI